MNWSFIFNLMFLTSTSFASVPTAVCPELAENYLCHDETDAPEWELTLTQEVNTNGHTVYANESRTVVLVSDGAVYYKSEPGVTVATKSWCDEGRLHVENHTKYNLDGQTFEFKDHSINYRSEYGQYISDIYDEDKLYQSVECWPIAK